jgi:hypothetical protein
MRGDCKRSNSKDIPRLRAGLRRDFETASCHAEEPSPQLSPGTDRRLVGRGSKERDSRFVEWGEGSQTYTHYQNS